MAEHGTRRYPRNGCPRRRSSLRAGYLRTRGDDDRIVSACLRRLLLALRGSRRGHHLTEMHALRRARSTVRRTLEAQPPSCHTPTKRCMKPACFTHRYTLPFNSCLACITCCLRVLLWLEANLDSEVRVSSSKQAPLFAPLCLRAVSHSGRT